MLGCSNEKIKSIPLIFKGKWIEIGDDVELKVNYPSQLSITDNGFKMIQYNDVDDLSDTVTFNIVNPTIFFISENSIKIVNKNKGRFREADLTYSEGVLYLNEYISTGIYESGNEILAGGANIKFVRAK